MPLSLFSSLMGDWLPDAAFFRLCPSELSLQIALNKALNTGSVFSPVFKFLSFLCKKLLYSCKLLTICLHSLWLIEGQAKEKAFLSSGFFIGIHWYHNVKKECCLLQAVSGSAGKSSTLQLLPNVPLMMASKLFTTSGFWGPLSGFVEPLPGFTGKESMLLATKPWFKMT